MEVFYDPNYFTEKEMETLRTHKYESTGKSVLDELLNPFWEFCARNLPHVIS